MTPGGAGPTRPRDSAPRRGPWPRAARRRTEDTMELVPGRHVLGPEAEAATRLAAVLDGCLLAGLVTLDPHGDVTGFGAGAQALAGRAAEQTLGRPFVGVLDDPLEMAELADELGVEPGFPVLAELARTRAPSRRWVCVRADGELLVVRLGITELRSGGELTGYLAVMLDETDAVHAQEDLVQAEARWRVLMDHLPDTIMVLVEQGTGIKVVTGAGLQPHRARDSAGRWLKELTDHAQVPIGALLDAAFAGENQAAPHETVVNGREHEVLVCPLPPANGRAQALVLLRDVSRDRRREREITAAKQRADRLFEDAPQGIALLTLDGRVVRANPALRRLLGGDELVGHYLSDLSFVAHDGTLVRHLAQVAVGPGGHPATQWSARGADGVETHIVLSSSLLTGQDGEPDLVLTNLLDVSERYRYEQRLAHLADHDPLTGLANRRRFDADLARHVDECRRYGVRGAVLVLDLDHFKQVNDRLGHAAGDELLTEVAGCLSERLRSSDVVARLGGDEFAVLLPHADRKATELVAQSLVDQIRERLTSLGELQAAVTVSAGAVLVDQPDVTASGLLSAADSAMYAAKAAGRNQYVVRG